MSENNNWRDSPTKKMISKTDSSLVKFKALKKYYLVIFLMIAHATYHNSIRTTLIIKFTNCC